MSKNPDIYLLYEYMKKVPFTVRMSSCLPDLYGFLKPREIFR